jgi:Leucine-rich repeat (LRR) protein
MFSLPALQSINLSGNHLRELPASIGAAAALKNLDVANNAIITLPTSFSNLHLDKLNLDGNNLSQESLQILDVMNGTATVEPTTINNIKATRIKTKKAVYKKRHRK